MNFERQHGHSLQIVVQKEVLDCKKRLFSIFLHEEEARSVCDKGLFPGSVCIFIHMKQPSVGELFNIQLRPPAKLLNNFFIQIPPFIKISSFLTEVLSALE